MASTRITDVDEVFELLKEGDEILKGYESKREITFFLGNTGSGKSTLTRLLADKKLTAHKKESYYVIKDDEEKISETTLNSKTLHPEVLTVRDGAINICDCPGFGDSRGIKYDIAATYFVKNVLDRAEKVKFIFVVNFQSVQSGNHRTDFLTMLKHAIMLIKDVRKFQNNIGLVATKVENLGDPNEDGLIVPFSDEEMIGYVVDFLINYKENDLAANAQCSPAMSKLVDIFTSKSNGKYTRVGLFRRPLQAGVLTDNRIMQKCKNDILDMCEHGIPYAKFDKDDFGFSVSAESRLGISEFYVLIQQTITEHLENVVNNVRNEVKKVFKHPINYKRLKEKLVNDYALFDRMSRKNGADLEPDKVILRIAEEKYFTDVSPEEVAKIKQCLHYSESFKRFYMKDEKGEFYKWQKLFEKLRETCCNDKIVKTVLDRISDSLRIMKQSFVNYYNEKERKVGVSNVNENTVDDFIQHYEMITKMVEKVKEDPKTLYQQDNFNHVRCNELVQTIDAFTEKVTPCFEYVSYFVAKTHDKSVQQSIAVFEYNYVDEYIEKFDEIMTHVNSICRTNVSKKVYEYFCQEMDSVKKQLDIYYANKENTIPDLGSIEVELREESEVLRETISNIQGDRNRSLNLTDYFNALIAKCPEIYNTIQFMVACTKYMNHFNVNKGSAKEKIVKRLTDVLNYIQRSIDWSKFLMDLLNQLSSYNVRKMLRNNVSLSNYNNWGINVQNNVKTLDNSTFQMALVGLQVQQRVLNLAYFDVKKLNVSRLELVLDATIKTHLDYSYDSTESKLVCRGNYVLFDEVIGYMKENYETVKKLHVFALRTIFINVDLSMPGPDTELLIIAPKWEIRNQLTKIDMKGKNGENHKVTKASDGNETDLNGSDGLDGAPGDGGGYFFGIGQDFINGQNLEINTSGGNGGNGQDGGHGKDGANGNDGMEMERFERKFVSMHIVDQYTSFGTEGKKGGNGGNGGAKGPGGPKGHCVLVELKKIEAPSGIKMKNENGQDGAAGKPGRAGQGGKHGKTITRTKTFSYYSTVGAASTAMGPLCFGPLGVGAGLVAAAITIHKDVTNYRSKPVETRSAVYDPKTKRIKCALKGDEGQSKAYAPPSGGAEDQHNSIKDAKSDVKLEAVLEYIDYSNMEQSPLMQACTKSFQENVNSNETVLKLYDLTKLMKEFHTIDEEYKKFPNAHQQHLPAYRFFLQKIKGYVKVADEKEPVNILIRTVTDRIAALEEGNNNDAGSS